MMAREGELAISFDFISMFDFDVVLFDVRWRKPAWAWPYGIPDWSTLRKLPDNTAPVPGPVMVAQRADGV